ETLRLVDIDTAGQSAGPKSFARYLAALFQAQGEAVEVEEDGRGTAVRLRGWRLARGLEPVDPAAFEGWSELWRGALAAHDRRLGLQCVREPGGDVLLRIVAPGPAA